MKKKDKGKKKGSSEKNVDFGKHLRALNKHLDKAKEKAAEKGGGFDEFDDGKYRARAVDAKMGVSKNKRVQVVITWKFMDGDYKGKEKLDFEGLSEDHLPYLLRKLGEMGYETENLEDLDGELQQILDDIKKSKPKCKIRLKTKGDFQNVYVDGTLDEEEEEEEEDEDEESDDDDDEEESDDDDEEDEPKKKKGKKKSSKKKSKDDDEEEEEDDEEEDEEEEDEDSDDDDEEESDDDEEEEEEEEPKKKKKGRKGGKGKDDEEEEEDEEDEEEEEVEDEINVVVGSKVTANSKKEGKVKGKVVELFEAEGKVLIKTDKGKTLKLSADKILTVEESPEESVPKKKKKSKK